MAKTAICGIYKITNKINNKSYIGQSKDICVRWKQHIKHSKDCFYTNAIYLAIRKYGLENFDFSIFLLLKNVHLNNQMKKKFIILINLILMKMGII